MGYRNLRACIDDLERAGHLIRVEAEIDARLEAAEIHRRVFRSGGPALLFMRVKGCRFPMASNLFGSMERMRFMFRDTMEAVRRAIELKVDPNRFWTRPLRYSRAPWTALEHAASPLPARSHPGSPNDHRPVAADPVLARRWRRLRAVAAGVYGRCRRSRVDEIESGHVPRATVRRPL